MAKSKSSRVVVGTTVPGLDPVDPVEVHQAMRDKFAPLLRSLTPREREVIVRMAYGWKNRAIAAELGISTKTLDIHRANVQRKMGLAKQSGPFVLVAYYAAMGFLAGAPLLPNSKVIAEDVA